MRFSQNRIFSYSREQEVSPADRKSPSGFKGWLVDVVEANNEFGLLLREQASMIDEAKQNKATRNACKPLPHFPQEGLNDEHIQQH